jgi:hypothetical protein
LECAVGKYPIEDITNNKKNLIFWDVFEVVKNRDIKVPDGFSDNFKDFIQKWFYYFIFFQIPY